jgi:hypothetical protein
VKLTGKVVRVSSGSKFVDNKQRITLQVNDSFHGQLDVPNENGLSLDDEVEIFVFRKVQENEVITDEQRKVIEQTLEFQ